MTRPSAKTTVPETLQAFGEMFRAYYLENPSWGSLHIVFDDGNWDDDSVRSCIVFAVDRGDAEGLVLAVVLEDLSETQRRRLRDAIEMGGDR